MILKVIAEITRQPEKNPSQKEILDNKIIVNCTYANMTV